MKKFCVISLMVLSMIFFVSCGGDSDDEKGENNAEQTDADQTDTEQQKDDSDADTGSGDSGDSGDSVNDGDKTDSGDSADDGDKTDSGDSADDGDKTDSGDSADDGDETDSGNDEPIDDSNCETVVYKSMDMILYDVNEINIWFYDLETYEDTTPPLFFAELKFAKNVDELKGETVSLKGSDPNKEDGNRVFLYKKPYTAEEENFIAKTGEIHIEDVNEGNIKIKTTDIIFSAILISDTEEDYVWIEDPNGKCYKLAAFEWDSISAAGE